MPPLMPAAKLRPVLPRTSDAAAGRMLASMIADAFDDGYRPAVADGKSLARETADVRFAARGADAGRRCR